MSTRSATIIRQTTYRGEEHETKELMRFYRHCDGYPEGHGVDMARAVVLADKKGIAPEYWVQGVLEFFFCNNVGVEFETYGCEHGDIEFLYVIENTVDHRLGARRCDTLLVTISVYEIGWGTDYEKAQKNEPLFSGSAREYIEKFGR